MKSIIKLITYATNAIIETIDETIVFITVAPEYEGISDISMLGAAIVVDISTTSGAISANARITTGTKYFKNKRSETFHALPKFENPSLNKSKG